jgi:hypothetical protein
MSNPTMTPTEPAKQPRKQRLRWLVIAHLVIGLLMLMLVTWIPGPGAELAVAASVGIVFSQASLLGIWGGLGTSSGWNRLLSVVFAEPYGNSSFLLSFVIVLVTGVLLIIRCFRVRICVPAVDQAATSPFQFSIRQLLILTFVVACMVTLGKWLGLHLIPASSLPDAALIGSVLAAVGLISVWPVLGTRHPVLPSLIVVVFAAGIGFIVGTLFVPIAGWRLFWTTITSVEALLLVASLLVVRSCGYRLVKRQRGPAANNQAQPVS